MIALKRFRKNSSIKKRSAYQMCTAFGLSAKTFKKYLNQAIAAGYIKEESGYYRITKFQSIIREFCKANELSFGPHQILQDKNTSVKDILSLFQQHLISDNIIIKQKMAIAEKKLDLKLIDFSIRGTGQNEKFLPKHEYKRLKKLSGKGLLSVRHQKRLQESLNEDIITSARHTSKLLGVSINKANCLLKKTDVFERKILVEWVKGLSGYRFEEARALYPRATVIPLVQADLIKIAFGSELVLKNSPKIFSCAYTGTPLRLHVHACTPAHTGENISN